MRATVRNHSAPGSPFRVGGGDRFEAGSSVPSVDGAGRSRGNGAALAIVLAAALGMVALMPRAAAAQQCGSWDRPVVCTAGLVLVDADYDRVLLDPRSGVVLAPRQEIELEIDARDQRGRRFPPERLAVGYDSSRCRSLLRVELIDDGTLRVGATAPQGRCTLQIWLPNNLNFVWEIDFEIDVAARSSYDRDEAEIIARSLYVALLGRQPDAGGLGAATAEIQAGNLESQIAAMARSPEFRQQAAGRSPSELLEQFYQGVLGRAGDSAGTRLYLGDMRRGDYTSVLLRLIRSPEFEQRLQR